MSKLYVSFNDPMPKVEIFMKTENTFAINLIP